MMKWTFGDASELLWAWQGADTLLPLPRGGQAMKKRFLCKIGVHSWVVQRSRVFGGPQPMVTWVTKCKHCDAEAAVSVPIILDMKNMVRVNVTFAKSMIGAGDESIKVVDNRARIVGFDLHLPTPHPRSKQIHIL